MLKNLMKSVSLVIAMFAVSAPAVFANEVTFNCMNEANQSQIEGYLVIVGNERQAVALSESDQSNRIVRLRKYAVVMRGFTGDEGFYVLPSRDFTLRRFSTPGSTDGYVFTDRTRNLVLTCGIEQVVYANPALTSSN